MDSRDIELRSVIKFLLMKRMTGKEIFEELQSVYKDESPSKSFVYKWIGEFQRGRTSVLTEHHGGTQMKSEMKNKKPLLQLFVMRGGSLFEILPIIFM